MSSSNIQHFHRFNEVYEDPYQFFCNYLDGNITLDDIQNKCKIGKLNSEARSFIYKIFYHIIIQKYGKIK